MQTNYRTVAGSGEASYEISKSRFLAYVSPAETETDASQFIVAIKKRHWDATHNCSAYITGGSEQYQKADDDGEPSGTAGRPILEVLKKAAVTNTVIVVTRYFGGIKLGAGGLIRAYGKAAAAGLAAAGLMDRRLHTTMAIEADYTLQGVLENNLRTNGYPIIAKEYYEKVKILTLEICGQEAVLEEKVTDWTAATARVTRLQPQYVNIPCQTD